MRTVIAQAAMPELIRHDNDNDRGLAVKYGKARKKERHLEHGRSGLTDASFAYGRRNAIRELMILRFGGPCLTDDAEWLAEMLVPFIVEAAAFHKTREGERRCPEAEAVRYLRKVIPRWTEDHGDVLARLVSEAVAKRANAVALHDPAHGKHPRWLPTMPELVAALRVTRDEARLLRGWACIDPASPEEKREADKLRKRAERAAKGATPRSESLSATRPWEALGISRRTWYRKFGTVPSAPCSSHTYGPDEVVPSIPANDDIMLTLAIS